LTFLLDDLEALMVTKPITEIHRRINGKKPSRACYEYEYEYKYEYDEV